VLAAMEGGAKPAQKSTQKQASAPPTAGEESAAKQPSQKQTQGDTGRSAPAKAAQPKQQQQQQQPAQQEQQQEQEARRSQVPDSYLRALLANQMLEKGEPIPARWLRDWVGITEDKQQAALQE
jgi:hypothetical protein